MAEIALEVDHVFKKFKKGEIFNSLRDLIPAMTRQIFKLNKQGFLKKNEFWALNDVSFKVERGEAFGIMGSNGAGKSTMLKILSKIMNPSSGSIKTNGRISCLIEVSAGFHPDLTGRENVFLNGTILGMKRSEIKDKFDEIVAFSGLEDFIDTPVKRYSSGMFARLGFSVASHVNPDILIIDEVLSVGDFVFQQKCVEHMKKVVKNGTTIIFVSHNLRALGELCKKSLLLQKGQVLTIGPTNEVVQNYIKGIQDRSSITSEMKIFISDVQIRGENGEKGYFYSGQRVYIDVTVRSMDNYEQLAIVLIITNTDTVMVFNTSTERLGSGTFTLKKNQTMTCTFTLELHLGPGTYNLGTALHRYDIQKEYDFLPCAETFFISVDRDARGVANLYPEVSIGPIENFKTE